MSKEIAFRELVVTPHSDMNVPQPEKALRLSRYPDAERDDKGGWTSLLRERISGRFSGPFLSTRMCFCPAYVERDSPTWNHIDPPDAPQVWVAQVAVKTKGRDLKVRPQIFDIDPTAIPWKPEMLKANCGMVIGEDGRTQVAKWHIGGVINLYETLMNHFTETGAFKGTCKFSDYKDGIGKLEEEIATFTKARAAAAKEGKAFNVNTWKGNYAGRYVIAELVPMEVSLATGPLLARSM
jgi:hypothetical protein